MRHLRRSLAADLARGRALPFILAVSRRAIELMEAELQARGRRLLVYENLNIGGFSGAVAWQREKLNEAAIPFARKQIDPERHVQKLEEYAYFAGELVARQERWREVLEDKQRGIAYLIRQSPEVKFVVGEIADALMAWRREHEADDDYLRLSPRDAMLRMLFRERLDLVAALRIAQTLPLDVERRDIAVERPVFVEVTEIAIGFIPVVGTAVALYEAYSGADLFGYRLDPLERSILGVTALLPMAGRFIKGGRALYTARQMEKLYGRDAREWSLAMARAGALSANVPAVRKLRDAEDAIRNGREIPAKAAKELAEAFRRTGLNSKAVAAAVDAVPAPIRQVLDTLRRRFSSLADLDEIAIERVIAKGPNVDHMKGQLLEELLEPKMLGWLRDPAGPTALGIKVPPGAKLEFIPGHIIRDFDGRQITDGIIGWRSAEALEILVIFEAKAGQRAARELRLTGATRSSLSDAERAELRAYAEDIRRELVEQARLKGTKVTKTIDEIEREVALSERGGQIRRDVERLDAGGDPETILIGGLEAKVRISSTRTKFFGVLPRDVRPGRMERDLRDLGYKFEVLGIDVRQRDLEEIAQNLISLVSTP